MKFKLGCELEYQIFNYTTLIFNICANNNQYQRILSEKINIEPSLDWEEYISPGVNNRYFRLNAPEGNLKVSYQAEVEVNYFAENIDKISEVLPAKLPLDTLYYLFPSRYCQSDRLMRLAQQEFGELLPDYSRVTAICNWIYDNVTYLSGSTNSETSAYDTLIERAGVCRDFAHLGIALCRALNIPARFVSTYAYNLQPPDFHACFEAYLGDRWYLFDPTRLVPLDGLIRIGTGRDAADVSFATIFGALTLESMNIFVESLDKESSTTEKKAIGNI